MSPIATPDASLALVGREHASGVSWRSLDTTASAPQRSRVDGAGISMRERHVGWSPAAIPPLPATL